MLARFMHRLRLTSLKRKPHVKAYIKASRLHGEISNAMADYYFDGKFEQKFDADDSLALGTEKDGDTKPCEIDIYESSFDNTTREGLNGMMECLIYKAAENASCITEEFLQTRKYRKPEKVEMLKSMLASQAGFFEFTGASPDEGYVFLREVFSGREHTLAEMSLSGSKRLDDFYIYTRVITYRDISFNSGLCLLFTKTDPFVADFVKRQKNNYYPHGEFQRFLQLYNYYVKTPNRQVTITNPL